MLESTSIRQNAVVNKTKQFVSTDPCSHVSPINIILALIISNRCVRKAVAKCNRNQFGY